MPGQAKPRGWISLGLVTTPVHRVQPCTLADAVCLDASKLQESHIAYSSSCMAAALLLLMHFWSSLAGSEPITLAAPGTSDVISLIAKRQHQLSLWDFVVTFCLAAVSTPHCCCRRGSDFCTGVCASSLCPPHCCTSGAAPALSAAWACTRRYQGAGGREEGSSNPTASLQLTRVLAKFPSVCPCNAFVC